MQEAISGATATIIYGLRMSNPNPKYFESKPKIFQIRNYLSIMKFSLHSAGNATCETDSQLLIKFDLF